MKRISRIVATVAAAALMVPVTPAPVGAQPPLQVKTSYPGVLVEPGQTVRFDLDIVTSQPRRVDLSVVSAPDGWATSLRGGGFVVHGVFGDPEVPPSVELEVRVPPEVEPGEFQVQVQGTSGGLADTLTLSLLVEDRAPASVSLEAEFPSLRGTPDDSFTTRLTLNNDTPEETAFNITTDGPQGWRIDARPAVELQAATLNVEGGGSEDINVEIQPAPRTPVGEYPVVIRAAGPGGRGAEAEIIIDITGTVEMQFTTGDERLSGDVRAGRTTELPVMIRNEGTEPLRSVSLSASPPSGWEVEFTPQNVDVVEPGGAERVTALISPSGEAVAGDYTLTFNANAAEGGSDSFEYRATVQPSRFWVFVGLLLIAVALGGLWWVFQRYGRR